MDSFERNLQKLSNLVKNSGNEELRQAFTGFLKSFNCSMKNYLNFLQVMQNMTFLQKQWDNDFVVKK